MARSGSRSAMATRSGASPQPEPSRSSPFPRRKASRRALRAAQTAISGSPNTKAVRLAASPAGNEQSWRFAQRRGGLTSAPGVCHTAGVLKHPPGLYSGRNAHVRALLTDDLASSNPGRHLLALSEGCNLRWWFLLPSLAPALPRSCHRNGVCWSRYLVEGAGFPYV